MRVAPFPSATIESEAKREQSRDPLLSAGARPNLCLLPSLRRREEVGISVLVSRRVDRVSLFPGGGKWKVWPPLRVNKLPLSPSLGGAVGGAEVRAAWIYLLAEAGGLLSRRSVGSRGLVFLCDVGATEGPTSWGILLLGLALRHGGVGFVTFVKPQAGSFLGSNLAPVQVCWCVGGRSAAEVSVLRLLLLRRVVGAPWPTFVHRPISRRFTAGDSRLEGMVVLLLQRWRDPGGSASQLLFRCFSSDSACVSLCVCSCICS